MGEWSWRLTSTASADLDGLVPDEREQIAAKLDEICSSPWRDPPGNGAPPEQPTQEDRIGRFRLAVKFYREDKVLLVARIKPRSGAYTGD